MASWPAYANDSSAELATGGLVLVRNDDVEMRAEDLFISTREIRVRYRFFNKAARDVTVHVAFPMPDITVDQQDQNISIPTEDPVNFLGFTTQVNGRPVSASVEQRVFSKGTEHTALLRGLGVPLAPHAQGTGEALDRLPRAKQDEIIRLGLAEVEEYDAGKGMERHLAPRWTLKTTYFWQQTFPAQRETLIEHRYKPSVGVSLGTMIGTPDSVNEDWHKDYVRKYCIERDFLNSVERSRRSGGLTTPPYTEERIEYVL
jgi:hypothetical protein